MCEVARPVSTTTFEYRPWSLKFNDLLGNGDVGMNVSPPEFQATINGLSGPIRSGENMKFLSPPAVMSHCPQIRRVVLMTHVALVGWRGPCRPVDRMRASHCHHQRQVVPNQVRGFFDIETKAFIAYVKVGPNYGVLFSLGTELDAQYRDVLGQLVGAAGAQGIDLASTAGNPGPRRHQRSCI